MTQRPAEVRPTGRTWRNPSTWHLRTRLVLVAMALLVAICGAVGIVSYASMDFFLTKQLDTQLQPTGRDLVVPPGPPIPAPAPGADS